MALMANQSKRTATEEECDMIKQAICGDDISTIQQLIDDNIDVSNADIVDILGIHTTPLHYASGRGRIDIVKILLQEGADINAKDKYLQTPLYGAVMEDRTDIVKILIDKRADVNVKDEGHQTPLHHAARFGDTDTVKILIDNGADVNAKDENNETPLVVALEGALENDIDNGDVVKILVENGAEVDVKDGDHVILLFGAVCCGNIDIVKMLLEEGVNVNIQDGNNKTPLVVALEGALEYGSDNGDVVKILVENGAEVDVKDGDHVTLLLGAARCGNIDVVKMLLEEGVNVNIQDIIHRTPLDHAAIGGRTDIVEMLLEKGADVYAKDKRDDTPLHDAVSLDNTDIVKMLLKGGADVNAKNKYDDTPLHDAARWGNTDIVKMLLKEGADVNAKNKVNETSLEVAVCRDHREIVQFLVEDYHIDTSQFNEETREKINNLLKQRSSDYDKSHHDDSRSHHSRSRDDGRSDDDHQGSHDDGRSDDPQSATDTEQQVDQLTVEDVNKGYMDGELLGPDVRVALLGAEGSGKTSLCHTLVGKDFQDTAPTEGADHMEIIVESTTNWRPLTHEEKLEDLDNQKYLESMSSAVKLKKSRPFSFSSVSIAVSTSSLLHGSLVSSTAIASSTPAVYSTPTVSLPQLSTAISSAIPISSLSPTSASSILNYAINATNSALSSPIPYPCFDPQSSSNDPQHALATSIKRQKPSSPMPTKKQKLSSNSDLALPANKDSPFVSVRAIENLKAFRKSYDPKKKYVNIWDFAGQQVFQHTHGIFISEEVVCLIVFDAGLALDDVPERRYPNDRTPRRTALETICYWMELISSRVSRPSTSDSDLSILLPTFVLVGTHTDKVSLDNNNNIVQAVCFRKFVPIFKEALVGKPFSKHIAGSKNNQLFEEGSPSLFFICNLKRDPVVINGLKETVMQAASITRKTRPTRYVEIERKLMLVSSQGQIGIVRLDEVAKIAESCGLSTDKGELLKMTQYFHHKGALLHFHNVPSLSNIVILSPHWLTKLLTYVVTSLTCQPIDPVLAICAKRRQNEGLLEEELIHWSVEQFNKSESDCNRIIANLRGIPIIELFTKFQLIVDVTQSSIAGNRPRGDGERLFLVPHLLLPCEKAQPSKDFSFKILYNFPANFIPDNLVDHLIVKCAQWNNDRRYDLIRLSYQWVCFELGKHQTYEVRPNYKLDSIELTIIPDPIMSSADMAKGYKESNELINAVKEFIDDLMKEHMAAIYKKFPVECFIPCPDCNELHIKLKRFAITGNAYCPNQQSYCKLSRYREMLSSKGDPMPLVEDVDTYYSPYLQKPTMRPLLRFVIPRVAYMWSTVADFLDYDISTTEEIAEKYKDNPKKCCDGLFRDWITTNHGVASKTWDTLMTRLEEIDQLATAVSEIKKDLDNFFVLHRFT